MDDDGEIETKGGKGYASCYATEEKAKRDGQNRS